MKLEENLWTIDSFKDNYMYSSVGLLRLEIHTVLFEIHFITINSLCIVPKTSKNLNGRVLSGNSSEV
jgi:hypothetical protein